MMKSSELCVEVAFNGLISDVVKQKKKEEK